MDLEYDIDKDKDKLLYMWRNREKIAGTEAYKEAMRKSKRFFENVTLKFPSHWALAKALGRDPDKPSYLRSVVGTFEYLPNLGVSYYGT